MSAEGYWEVEFPDTKIQVSGEWTEQQAREAITAFITNHIQTTLHRVEPKPEIPEELVVTFGEQADVSQEVEETG